MYTYTLGGKKLPKHDRIGFGSDLPCVRLTPARLAATRPANGNDDKDIKLNNIIIITIVILIRITIMIIIYCVDLVQPGTPWFRHQVLTDAKQLQRWFGIGHPL